MKESMTFYVSPDGNDRADGSPSAPFATPARAIRAAREARRGGRAARVVLGGGEYRLSRPLRLGKDGSGLVVEAAPGARAVLSGLCGIAGWRREPDGLWSAAVPWVMSREKGFRTLFVDGGQRPRSRLPKGGAFFTAAKDPCPDGMDWITWAWKTPHHRVEIAKGDVDPAWDLQAGEAVFYHFWVDSHVIPRRVVEEGNRAFLELDLPLLRTPDDALWKLENLRQIATEPGEWALDCGTRRLYYRPRPGENMATVRAAAPRLERLLEIDGAEDVVFRGVTFAGSRYELPPGDRNDFQAAHLVDAAVSLVHARNCRFERCVFEDIGGYALEMRDGTRDCAVSRSAMRRLGAGGVRLNADVQGWRERQRGNAAAGGDTAVFDPRRRVANNEISDCEISGYGRDFASACGVLLMDAEHTRVVHNHIHDGYYTGVSCGWTWGFMPSASFGNEIAFNHIHDIGKGILSDMGAIYTLGVSPGTRIANNLVHDVDARVYGGLGIYSDEGSTGILIENNVVFDTKFSCYFMHFGRDCVVRNNVFGGGHIDQIGRARKMAQTSFHFYGNIVYWTEGALHSGDWDDSADYDFATTPSDVRKLRKTVECDWNLYFNPNMKRKDVRFGPGLTWAQWRARGQDVHSLWADPKFADPAAGDFAPAPDSPAFRLGFRPIDLSSVGPRPAAADWRPRPHEDIEWTTASAYGLADGSAHLPRVLLVGDSICRAYAEEVRKRLEGRMNVSYWSSSYCVTSAPYLEMLATCLDEADYDVIHFNNGLHSFNTPLEDYGKAYQAALELIRRRQPEAALVWCSCTPVADPVRTAQIRGINAAAAQAAAAAGVARGNDLFALCETFDRETAYVDGVHFRPGVVARQAELVANCVLTAASQTKSPNDRH